MKMLQAQTYADVLVTTAPNRKEAESRQAPAAPRSIPSTSGSRLLDAFDSHFHLDRLSKQLEQSWDNTLHTISNPTEVRIQHPVKVTGGVMVFDPERFDHVPSVFRDYKFAIAVGLHPKKAHLYNESVAQKLKQLTEMRLIRELGEVGLDRNTHPDTWARQEDVLDQVLKMCNSQLLLILHLRGNKKDRHQAAVSRKCLEIVRRHCPKEQRIHLHCFAGGLEQLQEWRTSYPNCYFGFTGLVAKFHKGQREALRRVPSDRLLIGTDAPYMSMLPGLRHSYPAYIGEVAHLVAEVRQEPVAVTLSSSLANGHRPYQTYTRLVPPYPKEAEKL